MRNSDQNNIDICIDDISNFCYLNDGPIIYQIDIINGNILRKIDRQYELGHGRNIFCISLSKCKKYLLTGSLDRSANLTRIDVFSQIVVQRFLEHSSIITCAIFLEIKECFVKEILTGSLDKTIKRWNIDTGECIQTYIGHTASITSLKVGYNENKNRFYSSSLDNSIICWDVVSGNIIKKMTGHTDNIYDLFIIDLSNEIRLVSASLDKTIKIWDITNFKCIKTLFSPTDKIFSIAITPDGNYIISGGTDRRVKIWDVITGKCVKKMELQNETIVKISLIYNKSLMRIVASTKSNVCIYSINSHFPIMMIESSYNNKIIRLYSDGAIKEFSISRENYYILETIDKYTITEYNFEFERLEISNYYKKKIIYLENFSKTESVKEWIDCIQAIKFKLFQQQVTYIKKNDIIFAGRFDLLQLKNFYFFNNFLSRNLLENIKFYLTI